MQKLIGRKKEIGTLSKFFDELNNGKGNIIFISGEAGVGKSFLVKEFFNQKEITVFTSTAYPENTSSYSLITSLLRQNIRRNNLNEIDFGQLTKFLSPILPEIENHNEVVSQETLCESVIQAIESLVTEKPLAIIFEDIHWADNSTLDLIPKLSERIKNLPLLIVCIYRNEELPGEHRLRKIKDTLRRLSTLNEIIINPFGFEEANNMIEEILKHPVDENYLKSVYEYTQGVPFYIEEIVRGLVENYQKNISDVGIESNYAIPIPQILKDAVNEKINSLSANAIEMLQTASILGNNFEIDFLLKLVNDEQSLGEIFEKNILVESGKGEFSFKNILIYKVIKDEIGWLHRKQIHRKTAALLSTSGSDPKQIAEHWLEAGEKNQAIEWLLKYAESLIQNHEYEKAAEESLRALQIINESTDVFYRISLLKLYAQCAQLTGKLEASKAATEDLIEIAKSKSDYKILGEAYRELASIYSLQNSLIDSINYRIKSAECFEAAGLLNESAQEYFIAARKKTSMLHVEQALLYADKSVKLSSLLENDPVKAKALGLYGNLLAMKGEVDIGRKMVQDALEIAININDTDAASEIYRRLASTLESQSDYISARNAYLNAYDFCINTGKEINAQVCLSCMSYIFFQTGEWTKSIEICRKVIYGKHTPETSIPVGYGMIGLIQAFRGESKSAIKSLKKALDYSVKYNTAAIELYVYWGLAVVYDNEMNDKAVSENYNLFLNRWRSTQEMHDVVQPLMWASNFFSERGMQKELSINLEILGRISSTTGNKEAMAALEFVIAESSLQNENYDEAIKHFKQALIHHTDLSVPLAKLMIEFRLGIALLKKQETEEAYKYLNSSLRCAKNLGAKPLAAKIKRATENSGAYLTESRNPESSERINKAGLTTRQLKVLELICEGLINKEIAAKLFVSSRTVDMHVSNILQRLNCKTRTEAINKAKELGII